SRRRGWAAVRSTSILAHPLRAISQMPATSEPQSRCILEGLRGWGHIYSQQDGHPGGRATIVQARFDTSWRRRALRGDREAVRAFAEAMLPPLYHFCLYRVGKDQHRCEEVVQETLVR